MANKNKEDIDPIIGKKGKWKWGILLSFLLYGFVAYEYYIGAAKKITGGRKGRREWIQCNEISCDSEFYLTLFFQLFMITMWVFGPSIVAWRVEKSFSDIEIENK